MTIDPSAFISFTSLLRTALQNAIKRAANGEKETCISVVDTQKADCSALYPARMLCQIYDIRSVGKTQQWLFTNEYLAYGVLDVSGEGASTTVSFSTLIENGFKRLFPEVKGSTSNVRVGGGAHNAQDSLVQLCSFWKNMTPWRALSELEVNLALLLASQFGDGLGLDPDHCIPECKEAHAKRSGDLESG